MPATATGNHRYLFLIPKTIDNGFSQPPVTADETITLKSPQIPKAVHLLASGKPLSFTGALGEVVIIIPATERSTLGDVVEIVLK